MGGKKLRCFTGHRSFKVAWISGGGDYTKITICGAVRYKRVKSSKNFEFRH